MIQICVSLTERTVADLTARMEELAGRADLFEVRADMLDDLDLLAILRAKTEPILFTCRSTAEGGQWRWDETQRRRILLEAVKRGFDYVDVELASGFTEVIEEKRGRGLILSHHDLEGTPADLESIYRRMAEAGADVAKIAVTPSSISDVGRLLAFADEVSSRGDGPPLVPIAMGPLGIITRLVGGRYKAPLTFASRRVGKGSAPGQLPLDLMLDVYRVHEVTRETRIYGILGTNVLNSLSPLLHNSAFEAAGLDAIYVPLQVDDLVAFIGALPALGLSGFSVTRPFKEEILSYLKHRDDEVLASGSANTVVVEPDGLRGATTDGQGVVGPLSRHVDLAGARAVIVGAGGAARAAARALVDAGARVTVLARNAESAARVAEVASCESGSLAEIDRHSWDVLVNATPVGSGSLSHETPVPAILHQPGSVVLDMVYDPLETILLQDARAAAATAIGGLEMLVAQALPQFEIFTGVPAPAEAMEEVAARLVGDPEA